MRKINPQPLNNDKWNRWRCDCEKATEECIKAYKCGEKPVLRFPVKGIHAQKPEELPGEQPLLINPASMLEDDNPEKHLRVNTNTGLLEYLTERGKMCIDIFGLNIRDQLVVDRLRACREIRNLYIQIITNPMKSDEIKAEISGIKKGKYSYTSASLAAIKEIQGLISD